MLDDLVRYVRLATVMQIDCKLPVRGQFANPVIVLDEVEKATGSSQSDPLAALYQLLEPETASTFRDDSSTSTSTPRRSSGC
jgi:hypothetical protein